MICKDATRHNREGDGTLGCKDAAKQNGEMLAVDYDYVGTARELLSPVLAPVVMFLLG